MEDDLPPPNSVESREPTVADLRKLCFDLNQAGARYLVIGGFAMAAPGYNRRTINIDLLVDTAGDNEARVLEAVARLPDDAARQVTPGEIAQWTVVRIADEIVVDLMQSACGIDYPAAATSVDLREIDGVPIPFASPDLLFLSEWFRARGRNPPAVE